MNPILRPDTAEIVDQDLRDKLETARGTGAFEFTRIRCLAEQDRRNELKGLGRDKRRRLTVRDELEQQPPSRQDLRHIHSVLAVCGLPYKQLPPNVRDYERRQGNMALDVTAGFLRDPSGNKVLQPVPYGPKARLILMHLCSEAIRQKSATIDIAETFTGFVRDMGFPDNGGRGGALTAFKEQLNALAACTMRLSLWTGQRVRTRTISPIEEIDLWLGTNPGQASLWPSTVTFSASMYESLKNHALPVNTKAVRAFAGSARKLDLYFWLGYRLHNIDSPVFLSWSALATQFGTGYARLRDFKPALNEDLKAIKDVFETLPVQLDENGLHLSPAGPEMLALPQKKLVAR